MNRKMRNKKGFSLIEMMAVIAIVAILVSIVMPVFGESKNKANAATNAANLRSVEGHLATLLVTNPEVFERDGLDDLYQQVGQVFDSGIRLIERSIETIEGLLRLVEYIPFLANQAREYREQIAEYRLEIERTQEARDHALEMLTYSYTATNGVITLNGITIPAPASKALDVDGLTLEDGVEMTVFVSDTKIYASYNGLLSSCFAIVADSGSGAAIADTEHEYSDVDDDRECDVCHDNTKHDSTEIELWYTINRLPG